MKSRPVAVVTGATGAVGPALVRRLDGEGWRVRALARAPPPDGLLPASTEFVPADVTDDRSIRPSCEGAEVVFHLAAKLHSYDPAAMAPAYHRANVEGTRVVVGAARAAGVRRLVFLSTSNVYAPPPPGAVLTEASATQPRDAYASSKLAAEAIARGMGSSVILRPAAVYGPHMKGNYRRMAQAIRRGRFVAIGPGTNRRALVHEDDLAQACVLGATQPRAVGNTYNVTDGRIHSFGEIVRAIALAAGRGAPRWRLPARPIRGVVRVGQAAFRAAGRNPPVTVAAFDKLLEEMPVDGTRIITELGFRPGYDLTAGWAATLAAWNGRGLG